MKILCPVKTPLPSASANSIQTVRMCETIAALGHEVTLLVLDFHGSSVPARDWRSYYDVREPVRLVRLRLPRVRGVEALALRLLTLWAKWRKPDLVFTRYLEFAAAAAQAGLPTVWEAHLPPNPGSERALRSLATLQRASAFRLLVVISSALGRFFAREYGVPQQRIHVAPSGAPDRGAEQGGGCPIELPANERLRIGYAGHLYPGRGMELVEALAGIRECYDFHVVGGTDADIASWRARLAGAGNVHIHGRLLPGEVAAFLDHMDVLIAPYQPVVHIAGSGGQDSARWMSPLKVFEYMRAAKPIIASDLPAIREVLSERNARLCQADDPHDWGRALDELAADSALRHQLAATARSDFEHEYRHSSRIERIIEKSATASHTATQRKSAEPR